VNRKYLLIQTRGYLVFRVPIPTENQILHQEKPGQALVAHACNPSFSVGRDQEDCGSKIAWANSLQDPISKKHITKKRVGGVAQGIGPEFKPQYQQKKEKPVCSWVWCTHL
jgi:hypothetical protein